MLIDDNYWIITACVGFVIIFISVCYGVTDAGPKERIKLDNPSTHIIITGGSSGIGLSTAIMLRKRNCSVSIIARNKTKLQEAKEEIEKHTLGKSGTLNIYSADVSNQIEIEKTIQECCLVHNNRVDVLITSAGISRPGYCEDVPISSYQSMININYLGSLYCALAVIPMMKKQGSGRLIFVSSLAGLCGMIGFAGYSASKYAVRGLAHSLQMELKPYDIWCSLVNPPDVDTPMLAEDKLYIPEETALLSQDGGLFVADDIARDIILTIQDWRFMVNTGIDGYLLGLVSTDMTTPSHSLTRSILEITSASVMRVVALIYLTMWNYTCRDIHMKKQKMQMDKEKAVQSDEETKSNI